MRRISILAVLAAIFLAIGGSAVLAAPGGDHGAPADHAASSNACPPASPNPDNDNPPNCGNTGDQGNSGDHTTGAQACPDASPNAGATPPNCGNGDNGNGDNGGNHGDNGNGGAHECPPTSPNAGATPPNCGNGNGDDEGDSGHKAACADGVDNDNDGKVDADDPGCHTDGDATNADSYDPEDNDETDAPPTTNANPCASGGLAGADQATIAKQAYDGGLSAIPILKDPMADGPLSSQLESGLEPLNPVGHEVACLVSLIDENANS